MVLESKSCKRCGSINIFKNGSNSVGNPKYKCKACGFGGVFDSRQYSESFKDQVVSASLERCSSRGLSRIFGMSDQSALNWIKKKVESLDPSETLVDYEQKDVLELDELWSFVQCKSNKQWIWIALCRRTRQVVASFVGDRSEKSCQALWDLVPAHYKKSILYSDFWGAYGKVLVDQKHTAVGKESGQTNHVERWNNTLRQRIGRFGRKTLSFSKSETMHKLYLKLFIYFYNKSLLTG